MTGCITVASYNVHGCVGKDQARDAKRVAQVIRALKSDIVGLQEVESRVGASEESMQKDYLAFATGLRAIEGPAIQSHDRHYGNLLLTNHPVQDIRRLDLSVRGQEPRGALDVDLDVRGIATRVIVTHFGLGVAERRFQATCLLKALDQNDNRRLTIVMGDFNEWFPLSRSLGWLRRRFGDTPAPRTYPAFLPLLSLDRIWVSPPGALVEIEAQNTGETRLCSDHLPLKAAIRVPDSIEGVAIRPDPA